MARRTLELSLVADRGHPGPLTSQVAGQLRDAMADGRLATGERLPSTRMLADLLGVSRTVVTGAYAQLFAEGWVEGRAGPARRQRRPGTGGPPGRRRGAGPGPGSRAGRGSADQPAAWHRVDPGDRPRGMAPRVAQRWRERDQR